MIDSQTRIELRMKAVELATSVVAFRLRCEAEAKQGADETLDFAKAHLVGAENSFNSFDQLLRTA
jgi:hypothetical protein